MSGTEANPRERLASYLGCEVRLVHVAFQPEIVPETLTKRYLDARATTLETLEQTLTAAERLQKRLARLPSSEIELMKANGIVAQQEIDALIDHLRAHSGILAEWKKAEDRSGGREPAAYVIARGIARAFKMQGRSVTWGVNQAQAGEPSTDFGRAVQFAFKVFGVEQDWKLPAGSAQQFIQSSPEAYRRAPSANSPN